MPTRVTDLRLRGVVAGDLVTIEQIAKLARREKATVNSWKARDHKGRSEVPPLPQPLLPTEAQEGMRTPLYSLREILTHLNVTGRMPAGGPDWQAAGVTPPAGSV